MPVRNDAATAKGILLTTLSLEAKLRFAFCYLPCLPLRRFLLVIFLLTRLPISVFNDVAGIEVGVEPGVRVPEPFQFFFANTSPKVGILSVVFASYLSRIVTVFLRLSRRSIFTSW